MLGAVVAVNCVESAATQAESERSNAKHCCAPRSMTQEGALPTSPAAFAAPFNTVWHSAAASLTPQTARETRGSLRSLSSHPATTTRPSLPSPTLRRGDPVPRVFPPAFERSPRARWPLRRCRVRRICHLFYFPRGRHESLVARVTPTPPPPQSLHRVRPRQPSMDSHSASDRETRRSYSFFTIGRFLRKVVIIFTTSSRLEFLRRESFLNLQT